MFAASTYEEIERIESQVENMEIVVFLFARPTEEKILKEFEYIHYNSAKYCSIYAIGYTDDFAKAEDQTYRKVDAMMQRDWYFSTKAFTEFKEKLQDRIRWNYSGETEVLVLQNNPGQKNVLNFQNYVAINVNKGIREEYIDSFQSFIDAAKNKNNNGVVVYPTKQPYEELDQVGYWCLLNVLKAKDFQEFLGNSEAFDFYCEYAKFDFSRFDVSWLLNLYPHTLEQIAKNAKVKERVRVAIATTLDGEAIAPSDSQRLQSILVKHFC